MTKGAHVIIKDWLHASITRRCKPLHEVISALLYTTHNVLYFSVMPFKQLQFLESYSAKQTRSQQQAS